MSAENSGTAAAGAGFLLGPFVLLWVFGLTVAYTVLIAFVLAVLVPMVALPLSGLIVWLGPSLFSAVREGFWSHSWAPIAGIVFMIIVLAVVGLLCVIEIVLSRFMFVLWTFWVARLLYLQGILTYFIAYFMFNANWSPQTVAQYNAEFGILGFLAKRLSDLNYDIYPFVVTCLGLWRFAFLAPYRWISGVWSPAQQEIFLVPMIVASLITFAVAAALVASRIRWYRISRKRRAEAY